MTSMRPSDNPRLTLRALCTALLVAALAGCGPETPAELFEHEVAPVLERRCTAAACHGVAPSAVAAGEVVDWSNLYVEIDANGRIRDLIAARRAAVRALGDDPDPEASPLLRKPLPPAWGGRPHYGGVGFSSPDDPAYRTLLTWAALEPRLLAPPLDPAEQLFADTVQPALLSASCANASCHGLDSAVPFHIDPGLAGRVGLTATRFNYAEAITMLALAGDPDQSRLLRKGLPLHLGGIRHKGGNTAFFRGPDDPRAAAIRAWACAERLARVGLPCDSAPSLPAFVFVRGPLAARDIFDLDVWAPGTAILLARPRAPGPGFDLEELTTRLSPDPLDARDPAVDPTATRLLLALRRGPAAGHRIHLLDLSSGALTQLTHDPPDPRASDRDPTWGPDGHVWFVSNRAGHMADGGRLLDADLYELDPATGALHRRTFTPHIERKPVFFVLGAENGGEMSFSALRDAVPSARRAHGFRFPPGLDTEYHQHFGITPPERLFFDTRELPDGRYVAVIGDLSAAWGAGGLGVVDRNFGPEIPPGAPAQAPSMPGYAPPLRRLDGHGALYRDPSPLPDGSILVAVAPDAAAAASDPSPPPDFAIGRVTLREAPDGDGPVLVASDVLVDAPGLADRDPEPLVTRPPLRAVAPSPVPPELTTGTLHHQGLPIIDALLSHLAPAGPKPIRGDFEAVRLVEALPRTPAQSQPVPAAATRYHVEGATTDSLSGHSPARVLAELLLAPDGSFQAELPAGVPFRIQGLNARGMAVGAMHNRWLHVEPGQVLNQGVAGPEGYAVSCAVCHGALDGDPAHIIGDTDVITGASLTLSRYEGQDPRRPLPAPLVGDGTRAEVDFQRDVAPLLARSCAGCHAGPAAPAGLSLTATATAFYDDAYESLLAPDPARPGAYRWLDADRGSAARSPLLEVILGTELEAPGSPRSLTPHAGRPPLTEPEIGIIARWIDLGATWRGLEEP